jgi:hypothetical protein
MGNRFNPPGDPHRPTFLNPILRGLIELLSDPKEAHSLRRIVKDTIITMRTASMMRIYTCIKWAWTYKKKTRINPRPSPAVLNPGSATGTRFKQQQELAATLTLKFREDKIKSPLLTITTPTLPFYPHLNIHYLLPPLCFLTHRSLILSNLITSILLLMIKTRPRNIIS